MKEDGEVGTGDGVEESVVPGAIFACWDEVEGGAKFAESVGGELGVFGFGEFEGIRPGTPIGEGGETCEDGTFCGDVVGDEGAVCEVRVEVFPLVHDGLGVGGQGSAEEPFVGLGDLAILDEGEAELPGLVDVAIFIARRFKVDCGEFGQHGFCASSVSKTRRAWTVSRTSWTRTASAPLSAHQSARPRLPPRFLPVTFSPVSFLMMRLRLAPMRRRPWRAREGTLVRRWRSSSRVVPKPIMGSR